MISKGANWAILFDLDQTLILTQEIEPLRRRRAWSEVYQSFQQTSLPPGTHEFVQKAGKLANLGVVTSSPRPYAEKLLAFHGLEIPVIVAYHDVDVHKPEPDPIVTAARELGVPLHRTIYIGDEVEDVVAATRARSIPIAICWSGSTEALAAANARAICRNWEQVYKEVVLIAQT
jgi:HAD superfamily hydrolase (TIGR01549 family)